MIMCIQRQKVKDLGKSSEIYRCANFSGRKEYVGISSIKKLKEKK